MTIDLEHIRSQNPIEDVINEKFTLKKSGSRFIGTEHDSMVVTPKNGLYFWNSRGEHGDVFDFVGGRLAVGPGGRDVCRRRRTGRQAGAQQCPRRRPAAIKRHPCRPLERDTAPQGWTGAERRYVAEHVPNTVVLRSRSSASDRFCPGPQGCCIVA